MGMWAQIATANIKVFLPFRDRMRAIKRSVVPYSSNPDNDESAVSDGLEILRRVREAGVDLRGATVLEVGTGWIPTIPALFWIAGVQKIIGTDVERLMDEETIDHARSVVAARSSQVRRALDLPQDFDVRAGLDGFHLDYRCPFDYSTVPDASIDVLYSRAVLEHVKPEGLDVICSQAFRVLRPSGVMVHSVDNSDHFQHKDRSLSRVNFLRYGDRAWRLMCLDTQNYQNRIRHSEYAMRIADSGFSMIAAEGEPDPQALSSLESIPLAPRFLGADPHDLAILTSLFVARRP